MTFGLVLLGIIYLLYVLLVKGLLWKIILAIGGWFGIMMGLRIYVPDSTHECMTVSGYSLSWAIVIPSIVVMLAMLYTKDE
jgi:hypothetical protein